jgi:hypothetical protein
MKPLVRLIHWHAAEALDRARRLQQPGYTVEASLPPWPVLSRKLRRRPPAVIVISLDRLPSQGRDIALALLGQKTTRSVPLVFVGGAADKVAALRAKLPDATFRSWAEAAAAVAQIIADPRVVVPASPVGPVGAMAGYSGTPLPKKLGFKPGLTVALLGAPADFAATLGDLPAGAVLTHQVTAATKFALWFVRNRREFDRGLTRAVQLAARRPVWVVSPKKSGPLATDLSQNDIRSVCLAAGLVDYKVCAVDAAWSALLFRYRRAVVGPGS